MRRAEQIIYLDLTQISAYAVTERCCVLPGVSWHSHSLQVCPGRQHQGSKWCATEPGCGAVVASSEHIALLAEQQEACKVLAAVVDESSGEAGSRDGVCQHFSPGGLGNEFLAAGLARWVHHEGMGQLCIICQLHPCNRVRRIG